jgi:hypothetical protein
MSAAASRKHPSIAPDDHRLQLAIRVAERSSCDELGAARNEIGQIEAGRRREFESVQPLRSGWMAQYYTKILSYISLEGGKSPASWSCGVAEKSA